MEIPDLTEATISDIAEENDKIRLLQETFQKKMRREMENYAEKLVKDNRDRVTAALDTLKDNFTGKKKYCWTDKNAKVVENMVNDFLNLDIIDDARLKKALVDFKAKYIDGTTSAMIRNSTKIQKEMVDALTAISTIILDAAEIKALSDAYRQKVNI
jgi:hypothetical protein